MYPGYTNCCRPYIDFVAPPPPPPWSLLMVIPWICVPWIHKLLLILDTLCCPLVCSLESPNGITLEMCTLDTQFVVDPRYTLLSPGFLFLDTLRCPLFSPYGITLEMCTLDTQIAVDPIYTWFPPCLSFWYYLGDVYPGYTNCCRS